MRPKESRKSIFSIEIYASLFLKINLTIKKLLSAANILQKQVIKYVLQNKKCKIKNSVRRFPNVPCELITLNLFVNYIAAKHKTFVCKHHIC